MKRIKVHTFGETLYSSAESVVLSHDTQRGSTPYATHREDAKGDLYLGHYFETLEEAEADFRHRVSKFNR